MADANMRALAERHEEYGLTDSDRDQLKTACKRFSAGIVYCLGTGAYIGRRASLTLGPERWRQLFLMTTFGTAHYFLFGRTFGAALSYSHLASDSESLARIDVAMARYRAGILREEADRLEASGRALHQVFPRFCTWPRTRNQSV